MEVYLVFWGVYVVARLCRRIRLLPRREGRGNVMGRLSNGCEYELMRGVAVRLDSFSNRGIFGLFFSFERIETSEKKVVELFCHCRAEKVVGRLR